MRLDITNINIPSLSSSIIYYVKYLAASLSISYDTHHAIRRIIKISLKTIFLSLALYSSSNIQADTDTKFVVFYGDTFPAKCEHEFNLYIFAPHTKADIKKLAKKYLVAGYLSLGEVDIKQPYYERISREKFILHNNPVWPNAKLIDVRNEAWQTFILEKLIPDLIERGFNGLFLDTLDSIIELERLNPAKFSGSIDSLVHLIHKINKQYSNLKLISNNALSILQRIDNNLEYVLAESLYTAYDFSQSKYQLATNDIRLNQATNIFSHITSKPLVLEYAIHEDTINSVLLKNRTHNYPLFFSNIQLNKDCSAYGHPATK